MRKGKTMRSINQTVLSLLIGVGISCLLLCGLLIKPALNGFHKFFTSAFEHPPIETTQTTQRATPRQDLSTRGQESQFPAEPKQDILEDKSSTGVRPLVALGGASKEDVFKLRKEAVAASPFAREDYEPSEEVFGQIVSGKPWIAATACSDSKNHFSTQGLSEESRFINNPAALVAIEMPVIFFGKKSWCTRDDVNTIAQNITYDSLNREIMIRYLDLPIKDSSRAFYAFNGLNARDLGYPYMYVDMPRSSYKLDFVDKNNNASTQVARLQNYIHVGPSCGIRGGCNNGSPRQTMLEFYADPVSSTQDREIYIKLWKEKPASVEDDADIVEHIIIQGEPEQNAN